MADPGTGGVLGRGQMPGHRRQTRQQAAGAGVRLGEDPVRRAEKAGLGTDGKHTGAEPRPQGHMQMKASAAFQKPDCAQETRGASDL